MITRQEELTRQLINSMQSQLQMNEIVVCAIKSLQMRAERLENQIDALPDELWEEPCLSSTKRFEL